MKRKIFKFNRKTLSNLKPMAGRKDCLKKLYRTPHIIHKTYFKLIKDYNVKIILKSCKILGDQRSNLEIRELFKA